MERLLLLLLLVDSTYATFHSVHTTSGTVIGHPAPYAPGVYEYLGVPYAMPPVGDLRFMPPVCYRSNSTINASAFLSDCPQTAPKTVSYPAQTSVYANIVKNFTSQTGNPQSEDCLGLNIWAATSPGRKAVLVWFHGGKFSIGSGNSILYNGQYLANTEDMIVVTVNYRLDIFGFPGSLALPSPNPGLLDQHLAIDWVHTNIDHFGGDPNRITIFGQSAGGCSVDYYAYAYPNDKLVAGIISHSGTAFSFAPNDPQVSERYFYNVSSLLGCGDRSSASILHCMQKVQNVSAILAAISLVKPVTPSKAIAAPLFHPTVDNQTVFSLAKYNELAAAGSFASTPYLAGNNDNEAGYYRISALSQNRSLTDAQWDRFNEEGFTCATAHAVAARATASIPSWRYRYFGDWDNLRLYPGSGSYHGSELTLLFGTTFNLTSVKDTEQETELGAYLQKMWASFARDPASGLSTKLGLPKYTVSGRSTLIGLALNDSVTPSMVDAQVYDATCAGLAGDVKQAEGAF